MCFLMVSAQPAQAILPLIVFALAVVAGYAFAYICSIWGGAPAGVTADSALELFFNSKNNEFNSLTVGLKDEASSLNATGYYLGRKSEYATMNFLNNTLYPTFPKWEIFNFSSSNMSQSVTYEISNTFNAWIDNYNSVLCDAVRYAQTGFTGPLASLNLKGDSTSLKTGDNDLTVVYGTGIYEHSIHTYLNTSIGTLIITNASNNLLVLWTNYPSDFPCVYVDNLITGNSMQLNFGTTSTYVSFHLNSGVYNVSICSRDQYNGDNVWGKVYTNALIVDADSGQWATHYVGFYSPSRAALYTNLNFIDTSLNTYTISATNTTNCDPLTLRYSLDLTQNFASSLSDAYWTTLENAGYHDISQIPPNLVIPLPDFAFLTNSDLALLSAQEIQAMYLAYLKALGNFFNSTTYTNIINFNTANVTFNNIGVIVNASASRNGTIYTEGDLYIQVYDDMDLVIGLNTLNSSGLLYNLNDTTCWSYAAGDVLNITHIYVRSSINDSYVEVTNATIRALTIDAYLYTSNSGPPLVPTGGSTGGGSSGGLLILAAVIILIMLSARGRAGSENNTYIRRLTPPRTKPSIKL